MTSLERKSLISHLAESQAAVLDVLENMDDSLFQYVPSEGQWSIAQIVEHIILVEKGILGKIKSLATTAPSEVAAVQIDHHQLIGLLTDRGRKAKSPESYIPKGVFTNTKEAITAFNEHRTDLETFLKTTTIPLQTIVFPHFILGAINGLSWMAFVAGHCLRHVTQMKAIKEGLVTKK